MSDGAWWLGGPGPDGFAGMVEDPQMRQARLTRQRERAVQAERWAALDRQINWWAVGELEAVKRRAREAMAAVDRILGLA